MVAANRAWASKASKAASRAKGAHCRAFADRRAWATCAAWRASSSSRRRRCRGLSGGGAQMRLQARQGCSQAAIFVRQVRTGWLALPEKGGVGAAGWLSATESVFRLHVKVVGWLLSMATGATSYVAFWLPGMRAVTAQPGRDTSSANFESRT